MTDPLFPGVGVALVTLFHDDGALDAHATAELAGELVELGVHGVVVAGTTGEAAALDAVERVALLTAVRAEIGGRVPVIAGTGAPATETAVGFTRDAVAAGADALLVLSPPGVDDPRAYYDAVVDAAGALPVLGYHYPAVSAPGIRVSLLPELPIAGLKDSTGDRDRLVEELAVWRRPTYTGSSGILTFAGPVGAHGAILGLANVEPEGCIRAFGGDGEAEARILPAHEASRVRFPLGLKELVAKRFGTSTYTRVSR
jgi:4-hydroxy-tetrahydrodipicolinate synthase